MTLLRTKDINKYHLNLAPTNKNGTTSRYNKVKGNLRMHFFIRFSDCFYTYRTIMVFLFLFYKTSHFLATLKYFTFPSVLLAMRNNWLRKKSFTMSKVNGIRKKELRGPSASEFLICVNGTLKDRLNVAIKITKNAANNTVRKTTFVPYNISPLKESS